MRWVLALLVLVGCDFVDVDEGIGVAAPRVLASSPSGNPSLATDGVIDFRVEAEDEDSLNLTWTFFADDIALMAKTKNGLRELLKHCSDYATDWYLTFNPNKSELLSVSGIMTTAKLQKLITRHLTGQNIRSRIAIANAARGAF